MSFIYCHLNFHASLLRPWRFPDQNQMYMLLLKIILFWLFDKSRLLFTRLPLLFIIQPKYLYSLTFSRKLSLNLTKEFCGLPQLFRSIIVLDFVLHLQPIAFYHNILRGYVGYFVILSYFSKG